MNLQKSLKIAWSTNSNKNFGEEMLNQWQLALKDKTLSVGILNKISKVLGYKMWEFIKLGSEQK